MSNSRIPSSLEGIKRLAKKLSSEKSIKHMAALDEASVFAGYANFAHARRVLSPRPPASATRPPAAPSEVAGDRRLSDFHVRVRAQWAELVNRLAPDGNVSLVWTDLAAIIRTLAPFMGRNANHGHLPTGGGYDLRSVAPSIEKGCIDFATSDYHDIVVRPQRLVLERLASDPAESFLMLELDGLEPSGVYDRATAAMEDVVDPGNGSYFSLVGSDDGFYTDADGFRRELPGSSRWVTRLFRGKIMLVTKGSIWNGSPDTYRGIHNAMRNDDIREAIQGAIIARSEHFEVPVTSRSAPAA